MRFLGTWRTWTVEASWREGATGEAFANLDAVFALKGKTITDASYTSCQYVRIGDVGYYVKRYTAGGGHLRNWIGRVRIRGEWENLLRFAEWGIAVPPIVAYGMERRNGRFIRGALVTQEVEGCESLATLNKRNDARLRDPAWVDAVSRQLGGALGEMHRRGFAHGDMKWRNVLVTGDDPPRVVLIDCPIGRFWSGPLLSYRKTRDLAMLDKVARRHLGIKQRVRYFHYYIGRPKMTREDKRLLRRESRDWPPKGTSVWRAPERASR